MTSLDISDIHKSFGNNPVLTGIDLSVPDGSFTAILGPSGSGKTTLLRVIAGFESASRGVITLGDRVIDGPGVHVVPERRGLGYVPQEGALFPHLDVAANIGFGLRRADRRGARVSELLKLVGLTDLHSRFPHQLSGGQQQRVALARALALEPAVVLLDEPFSSLDAALANSVRADIGRILKASRTTVVLVTHDQDEALSMADQVAVLRDGQVAQVGTPDDLYENPIDPSLAMFLGEANLLSADVVKNQAVTAMGLLSVAGEPDGPALVLVRPEHIAISQDDDARGLRGQVMEHAYHGHDALVRVRPDEPCGTDVVIVRVHDSARYQPGSRVTLTTTGPARSWPVTRR